MKVPVSLNKYGLDERNREGHVNVENIHIEQEIRKSSHQFLNCMAKPLRLAVMTPSSQLIFSSSATSPGTRG